MPKAEVRPSGDRSPHPEKKPHIITRRVPLRVSPDKLPSLYIGSSAFRAVINQGNYVYVDDLFVMKPLALFLLKEGLSPASFFLHNQRFRDASLTKYCLCIEYHIEAYPYNPDELYHSEGRVKKKVLVDAEKIADIDTISEDKFLQITSGGSEPPFKFNFGDMLKFFMEQKSITDERLSELTGIPTRTIGRMKNEDDYNPSIEKVVAVCIALHLSPCEALGLVDAAGLSFRATPRGRALRYLVTINYNQSVSACNAFLKRMRQDPLTVMDGGD